MIAWNRQSMLRQEAPRASRRQSRALEFRRESQETDEKRHSLAPKCVTPPARPADRMLTAYAEGR